MSLVQYAYIAKPTAEQVGKFLTELGSRGISISHLGKSDPARKFKGNQDEALSMIFEGTDLTNSTFARDAALKLHLTFEVHHDPRWTSSTVSASCVDPNVLNFIADSAAATFDLFLTIRGVSGAGKEQRWEIIHVTEKCPSDLRARIDRCSS